jgi:hypothetical protein
MLTCGDTPFTRGDRMWTVGEFFYLADRAGKNKSRADKIHPAFIGRPVLDQLRYPIRILARAAP